MNQCTFLGRLTRDPETREVGSTSVTQFSIAVTRDYKNKDTGERDSDFFDMECWSKQGETIEKYFSKGDPIIVNAQAVLNRWEAEDGGKRSKIKFSVSSFEFIPKTSGGNSNHSETENEAEKTSSLITSDVTGGKPF